MNVIKTRYCPTWMVGVELDYAYRTSVHRESYTPIAYCPATNETQVRMRVYLTSPIPAELQIALHQGVMGGLEGLPDCQIKRDLTILERHKGRLILGDGRTDSPSFAIVLWARGRLENPIRFVIDAYRAMWNGKLNPHLPSTR